jgi:1-deoxy-D-xylulose-5-phosphate synthase
MKILMEAMPERVFDVGIAEQHAVTFSAGLALSGKRPFCNIYSSFLQRAYDQVIHDVALQKIPVVFCLDRAGLVGEDGPTHHGVFDLAFLSPIPNIQILAPMDRFELERMMIWAKDYLDGPVFIRYPKGRCVLSEDMTGSTSENFSPRKISEGRELAVLSIGAIGTEVKAASGNFDTGILEHWDMRKLKPLDTSALKPIFENFKRILTVEDGVMKAGLSDQIRAMGSAMGYGGMIHSLGIPDEFSPHASIPELKELYSLDVKGTTSVIKDLL